MSILRFRCDNNKMSHARGPQLCSCNHSGVFLAYSRDPRPREHADNTIPGENGLFASTAALARPMDRQSVDQLSMQVPFRSCVPILHVARYE